MRTLNINNISELTGKKIVTLAFGDKANHPYVDCFVVAGVGHNGNDTRNEILAEDGHRTYMFQEEEKYGGDTNAFSISDYGRYIHYAIVEEDGSYDFGNEEYNDIFEIETKDDRVIIDRLAIKSSTKKLTGHKLDRGSLTLYYTQNGEEFRQLIDFHDTYGDFTWEEWKEAEELNDFDEDSLFEIEMEFIIAQVLKD